MMSMDCLNGVLGATNTGTANTLDVTIINMALNAISAAPTGASNLAGGLSTANAGASSAVNNIQPTAGAGIVKTAENLLSTVAAEVSAPVGNLLRTAAAVNDLPNILPGNANDAATPAANIVSHLSTIVNGRSTIRPIVMTILNSNPTAIPAINTVMNGVPTNLPVLNTPVGQLAQALGLSKGRTRVLRREVDDHKEKGDI
jgi:hypothetical protein